MSEIINTCSICQEEKYSYFRRITEAAKLKAEKRGYYNLKVGAPICSKCYNEKIQYDRNEHKKKKEDRPFKKQKSMESLASITNNEDIFSTEELKREILKLNKEIEMLRRPINEKIIGK